MHKKQYKILAIDGATRLQSSKVSKSTKSDEKSLKPLQNLKKNYQDK